MAVAMSRRFILAVVLLVSLFGCTKRPPSPPDSLAPSGLRSQKPYQINGVWYYPLPSAAGYVEEGIASWYGAEFHGKPTACGEPYDMFAMTAAHKTLPLGTHVKVTNPRNNRSVILRINDRGPFVPGRIIDLSCRAAQELGTISGIAPVRVEAVQVAAPEPVGTQTYWRVDPVPSFRFGQFAIQVGAFREPSNAYRLKEIMQEYYSEIIVQPVTFTEGPYYRVQVGRYGDILLAKEELQKLRSRGFTDAFVVAADGR